MLYEVSMQVAIIWPDADVEDQAAKISVEEQRYLTTIQSIEKDLETGMLLLACYSVVTYIPYRHTC